MKHFYYQLPMAFIVFSFLTLVLPLLSENNHNVICLPVGHPESYVRLHLRSKNDDDDDGNDDSKSDNDDETTDSGESDKKRHKDKDKESKGGDDDGRGGKYDIKVIILTGVMVAAVLFMAFFCFLGICNLQCCCGALIGAVSGAKIGNQQREQQIKQQQQTSGSKNRKRGHSSSSSKSYPIVIETDSSGGSSSSRRKKKNRTMVVTVGRNGSASAEEVFENAEGQKCKLKSEEDEELSKASKRKQCSSLDGDDDESSYSDSLLLFTDDTESVSTSSQNSTVTSSTDSRDGGLSSGETMADSSDYTGSSSSVSTNSTDTVCFEAIIDRLIAELGADVLTPSPVENSCQSTAAKVDVVMDNEGDPENLSSPSPPMTQSSSSRKEEAEELKKDKAPLSPTVKAHLLTTSKLISQMLTLYKESKAKSGTGDEDAPSSPSSSSVSPPTLLTPSLLDKLS